MIAIVCALSECCEPVLSAVCVLGESGAGKTFTTGKVDAECA